MARRREQWYCGRGARRLSGAGGVTQAEPDSNVLAPGGAQGGAGSESYVYVY